MTAERIVKSMLINNPDETPSFSRHMDKYGDKYSNQLSIYQFNQFCRDLKIDKWLPDHE